MNIKLLVSIIVVLMAALAGYKIINSSDLDYGKQKDETEILDRHDNSKDNNQKGQYIEYSESEFAKHKAKRRILFFHASWCPQCRALESDIKNSSIPENVVIFKVDYDSNQSLRKQYGVTLQTTLILTNPNGKKIKSYVAYNEPTFANLKNELID